MAEDIEPIINEVDPPPSEDEKSAAFKALYLEYVESNIDQASSAYQKNYWSGMASTYIPDNWDGKDQTVLQNAVLTAVKDLESRGATTEQYSETKNTCGGYPYDSMLSSFNNLVPRRGNHVATKVWGECHKIASYKTYDQWEFVGFASYNDGGTEFFEVTSMAMVKDYVPTYNGVWIHNFNPDTVKAYADVYAVFTVLRDEYDPKEKQIYVPCSAKGISGYYYDVFTLKEKLKKKTSPSPSPSPSSSSRLFIEATSGVSGRHGSPIPTVLEYTIPTARTDATVYGSGGDGGHGGGGGAGASCPLICEFETDKADSVNQTVYAQHHGYGGKGGAAGKGGNGCVIVFY